MWTDFRKDIDDINHSLNSCKEYTHESASNTTLNIINISMGRNSL